MDVATFNQFHNFTCYLIEIDTAKKGFHTLLPPLKEKCFSDSEYSNLQAMYDLLYPNSLITQAYQPFLHGIKANDNKTRKSIFLCNQDLKDLLLFLLICLVYMKMV